MQRLTPFEDLAQELTGQRELDDDLLAVYHKQYAYSFEELDQVIRVMGAIGQEATGSMGDDTPFAVLSSKERPIYDYFRQKFAQVTNPPIDPLRENHVMSLATCIGREQNVFNETTGHAKRLQFSSPVLMFSDMTQLLLADQAHYNSCTINLNYLIEEGLAAAVSRVCDEAQAQAESGVVLIVLSDKGLTPAHLPIPAAMAVGAVHQRLVKNNLRCDANIIVETASCRDPHQFAVLLGFWCDGYLSVSSLRNPNANVR